MFLADNSHSQVACQGKHDWLNGRCMHMLNLLLPGPSSFATAMNVKFKATNAVYENPAIQD